MNSRIANKILLRNFRRDLCHFISASQNVKKSNTIHLMNFRQERNERNSFSFVFSKNIRQYFLCHASASLYMASQKRSISNNALDTNVSQNLPQLSTSDVSPTNETMNIISSDLPNYLTTFSDWKIVELAQQTLLHVHEITGLPWWTSIVLTAFVARTVVTLPFSIIQIRNTVKLQLLQEEMTDVVKKLKREANYACTYHGWPEALARKEYKKELKKEWNELIVRENCHPAKSYILVLIQLPLWFSFSVATRNLCYMLPRSDFSAQVTYLEMTVGGFGWVTNLAVTDPYLVLPIALTLVNLAILEVHQLFKTGPSTKLDKWRSYFFRTISVIMLPIAACMPAATNIYWLTSSSFGLLQAFLLNSTRLRRLFKVPIVESELKHPYRYFYGNLKSRLRLPAK